MLILCLDSSAIASVALLNDDGVVASFATQDTRTHAEVLAPAVQHLLAEAGIDGRDLDAVVTGTGPGPFTGLRVGIATARTLAFVWGVPLHGVMSLDAIAFDAREHARQRSLDEFLVTTDARRKEVYWARYAVVRNADSPDSPSRVALPEPPSAEGLPAIPTGYAVQPLLSLHTVQSVQSLPVLLEGPAVGSPESLPGLPAYGRGAGLYNEVLHTVTEFGNVQPTAASLGRVAMARLRAGADLTDTAPLYLRESDARVPGPRKRAL